jgi:hypothetical protein
MMSLRKIDVAQLSLLKHGDDSIVSIKGGISLPGTAGSQLLIYIK